MKARIRKIGVWVEETHIEGGKSISPPTRKAVAAAVIENPHAGQFVEDLADLMEVGTELGGLLGERAVAALGIAPSEAESYGKAAMVGENGELEHAAALLHPKMGAPLVAIAVTDSGRPLPRVGGLTHEEAVGDDGLR